MDARRRTRQAAVVAVLTLVVFVASGCDLIREVLDDRRPVAAVEHVAEVLAQAGREPAALPGAVHFRCGPTDAVLGSELTTEPITIDLAFADLAPVLADIARELPPPAPNPLAGAPAHIDRWETSGDGWRVRWGESFSKQMPNGGNATTVTLVDGGEVPGDVLREWIDERVVVDLRYCG